MHQRSGNLERNPAYVARVIRYRGNLTLKSPVAPPPRLPAKFHHRFLCFFTFERWAQSEVAERFLLVFMFSIVCQILYFSDITEITKTYRARRRGPVFDYFVSAGSRTDDAQPLPLSLNLRETLVDLGEVNLEIVREHLEGYPGSPHGLDELLPAGDGGCEDSPEKGSASRAVARSRVISTDSRAVSSYPSPPETLQRIVLPSSAVT